MNETQFLVFYHFFQCGDFLGGPNTVAHKQMRLEEALVNLDPLDMEKRRQADFGSENFVQGSVDEFFKLPYGVRTPESIM